MGTEKRERQKANRAKKQQAVKKAERFDGLRQRLSLFLVIGVFIFGALLLYRFRAEDGSENALDDTPALDQSAITTTTTTIPPTTEPLPSIEGETECPAEDGSSEQVLQFESAPPTCIDPTKTYTALVQTDRGDFTLELDASKAPNAVNNFVVLARYHYYDGAAFHRVIPGFVAQGGDPVGQPAGTGGPGYRFADELPGEGEYEIGSLAMANSGPNTNGSQFFVVTGEEGADLPNLYTLFGKVSDGMDVVSAIEDTGSAGGTPTEDTIISTITVTES